MEYTIQEVAQMLDVEENVVRGHIASGKLAFDIREDRIVIPQSAVDALLYPERKSGRAAPPLPTQVRSPQDEAMRFIVREILAIEDQLEAKWDLLTEHTRLQQLLREKDRGLSERSAEIDRLRRESGHQKSLAEQERKEREKALQEQMSLLERQVEQRLAQEREGCREQVARIEAHWAQKLAEAQEVFEQQLAAVGKQEGFWSRLMRLMTWS